jgi:NDP-sugar pyrophosphorylase family protein
MIGRPIHGAIIAAGDGSRFERAGIATPKPLVPVAGVPLIESVITNFVVAEVRSLVIIVNERHVTCAEWVRTRFPRLDVRFIVKTTRSSLESFSEVVRAAPAGPLLVSAVDTWCRPDEFAGFVERAARRPADASVLAVTQVGADESPLRVGLGPGGRIVRIGGDHGDLVTAGMYLLSERARRLTPVPTLSRLREFLAWLNARGERMYGEIVPAVIDVDDADDVALAEARVAARRA